MNGIYNNLIEIQLEFWQKEWEDKYANRKKR